MMNLLRCYVEPSSWKENDQGRLINVNERVYRLLVIKHLAQAPFQALRVPYRRSQQINFDFVGP